MDENEKEDFFFDKRDGNYTRINSDYKFLDLLGENVKKCKNVLIPETILVQGGQFKVWLFNSTKEPGNPILRRKQDRLTSNAVVNYFSKTVLNQDADEYESLYGGSVQQQEPVAYIKYINEENDLFDVNTLAEYLNEKLSVLKIIQIPLSVSTKSENYSNENFLVECRQDIDTNPPQYRFFKKITEFTRPDQNISSKFYQPKLIYGKSRKAQGAEGTHEATGPRGSLTSGVKLDIPREQQKIYKLVDANFNKRLEMPAKVVASYIQGLYGARVKKMITRFVQDKNGRIYLLGIEQLYLEFGPPRSFETLAKQSETYERTTPYSMNVGDLKDGKSIKRASSSMRNRNTHNSTKGFSTTMSGTVEKCQGDFCSYVHYDNLNFRAALKDPMHALLNPGQRYKFMEDEDEEEPLKLPFEISYHLIKRCREMPEAITDVLKQRKIYPKHDISRIQECMLQGKKVDFTVSFKRTEHEHFQTLYRFVKVCKNCYSTYVCLTKSLKKANGDAELTLGDHKADTRGKHPERKRVDAFNSSLYMKNPTSLTVNPDSIPQLPPVKPRTTLSQSIFNRTGSGFMSVRPARKIDINASSQRLMLGVCSILPPSRSEKQANEQQEMESSMRRTNVLQPAKKNSNLYDLGQDPANSPGIAMLSLGSPSRMGSSPARSPEERVRNADRNHRGTINVIVSNIQRSSIFDPFNIRKSKIAALGNRPERPSIQVTTAMPTVTTTKRFFSRKILNPTKGNELQPLYHHSGSSLRSIPYFRITTPKMDLKEKVNPTIVEKPAPALSFDAVCSIGNYNPPDRLKHHIDIFIVDDQTAIPYTVLASPCEPYQTNDVIVFCNDMFDNYIERLNYFQKLLNKTKNLKIVLFNFPGQAYTLFSKTTVYNNEYNATLIDLLLNELYESDRIDILCENLRFIGLGNGGNVLAYFLSLAENYLLSIRCAMFVNSFVFVDDFLRRMLVKARETFENTPSSLPDIAFQYFDITFGRRQLDIDQAQKRCQTNPISIEGRKVIIDGCLNCINLIQKIQSVRIPLVIVHSLQNNIVDVNHTYLFENTFEATKLRREKEKQTIDQFFKSQRRRLTLLCEGGYSLFDENGDDFQNYLKEFITSSLSNNNTLNMIFIEKMLNELEDSLLSLQEREIEDCKAIIIKLKSFCTLHKDGQEKLLSWADSVSAEFNAKIQDTRTRIEKSQENFKNVKIRMSKYELNEELNEKVLQNEERRLNDLVTHLENVVTIDQIPLNQLLQLARIQSRLDDNYISIEAIILGNEWERMHLRTIEIVKSEYADLGIEELEELRSKRERYCAIISAAISDNKEGLGVLKAIRDAGFNDMGDSLNWLESLTMTFASLSLNVQKFNMKLFAIALEVIPFVQQTNPETTRVEITFMSHYREIANAVEIIKLHQQRDQSVDLATEPGEAALVERCNLQFIVSITEQFEAKALAYTEKNYLHLTEGAKIMLEDLISKCRDIKLDT